MSKKVVSKIRFLSPPPESSSDDDNERRRKSTIDGIHDIEAVTDDKSGNAPVSPRSTRIRKQSSGISANGDVGTGDNISLLDGTTTIFDEAEDCLAQSLLIFLYADLRLLSATGRISTKYETLCIASDEARKTTAAQMSGICGGFAELIDDERTSKGISPAQIMAVLLIELRKEVMAWRKTRHWHFEEEESSIMTTLFDKNDRKKIEDDMHASLRCYNLMIGEDLRYDIPEFTASQPETFRGPRELADLIRNRISDERERRAALAALEEVERKDLQNGTSDSGSRLRRPRELVDLIRSHLQERTSLNIIETAGSAESAPAAISDSDLVLPNGPSLDNSDISPSKMSSATEPALTSPRETNEAIETAVPVAKTEEDFKKPRPFTRSRSTVDLRGSRSSQRFREEFQQRQQRVQQGLQNFTEVLREGDDAVARHRFEDVGDAFVWLAQEGVVDETGDLGTVRRKLSEEELLDYMEKAIESRDSGNLDFMNNFFKDGSVSQVMIKSPARVVWLNDWYPLKDCTYGISVDNERNRVLLVFRGAITRADWGHAGKMDLKKVENPIQEDFPSRTKYIKVHNGFYRYLFRTRKDTGTSKYDEISNILHHYGSKLGEEYELVVTGYSLGGALSTVFGFYASADERFKMKTIKLYTFGCPYVGGLEFYESFRHQERSRKIQHARFFNKRDGVTHLPVSWIGEYQHIGVSVRLPKVRSRVMRFLMPEPTPLIRFPKDKSRLGFYTRALKENYFFNMPLPWKIRETHSLNELQQRMIRARVLCEDEKQYPLHNKTLDELYEELVYNNVKVTKK